jgi:hypothetical protein
VRINFDFEDLLAAAVVSIIIKPPKNEHLPPDAARGELAAVFSRAKAISLS